MLEEQLLLAVDDVLAAVEVGLVGGDTTALGEDHVAEEEDEVERDTEVGGDEGGVVEALAGLDDEDAKVLGEGDDAAEEEGDVAAPDAEGRLVGHDAVGDVLGAAGLDEVDVGDEDGDPGQDAEDGGQVDEVLEDLTAVVADVHEGEEGEDGADDQRGPRHTAGVGLLEDGRGRTVRGETVERSAGDVEIRVGGGEDEDENAGVDDVGENADTGELGSDDEGRRVGARTRLGVGEGELGRVVRDDHADEEDAQAVEDEDTVKGELNGLGDAAARVLGLSGGDTNQLGTTGRVLVSRTSRVEASRVEGTYR